MFGDNRHSVINSISHYFYLAIFGFEMVLKLGADGFFTYISSGFNVFDGSIVILRFAIFLINFYSYLKTKFSFS